MARSRGNIPVFAAERRLGVRLRHAVGLRQTYEVGGVRYRELTTERLKHALSKKGGGAKEFEVIFRGAAPMRISATPGRVFADLSGPRLLGVYQRIEPVLRPGMRALLVSAGTGYAAEWVASRVAPSGAVVALDRDAQSIQYAQRRYAIPNVSFEVGGIEALSGETDGAFEAVMAVAAIGETDAPETLLKELWRAVAPAGWMMIACPSKAGIRESSDAACIGGERLMDLTTSVVTAVPAAAEGQSPHRPPPAPTVSAIGDERDGWAVVVALKPVEE